MLNIFTPNGIRPIKIINKLAREEFGDKIRESNNYTIIKHDIIKVLKRMSPNEFEENRLETLVWIEHIKDNDFGNFISVRFGYWGMIIAIAVAIIGDVPIYQYFNMSKRSFGNLCIAGLTILLITMSRTIHIQHDQLKYFNFKLLCFDEIHSNKSNNKKR